MASLLKIPALSLRGSSVPALGFGTYRLDPGAETENAVKAALEQGYRMFDTAAVYGNEESVGKAIKDSGIPRSDVFISTKLWDNAHGYEKTIEACKNSLRLLGCDYLDTYLIHSPNTGKLVETWDALLHLQRQGLTKHIGVSNFGQLHLEALKIAGRPMPAINQFEMHPVVFKARKSLCDYCIENGVLVQAYGSIFSGIQKHLEDERLVKIAKTKQKSVQQVLLRWGFQKGFQLIPKSKNPDRMLANASIFDFELNEDDVRELDGFEGKLNEYWQPLDVAVDIGATHHWNPELS